MGLFTRESPDDDANQAMEKRKMAILDKTKKFLGSEIVKREQWERKAYVNIMFREGHHWINEDGQLDNRDPNQLRRHVNKFKSVGRGLKNSITFNDPIIEVLPDNGENVDQRELDIASAIIRNEFKMAGSDNEGMKDIMRTVIDEAAHKSFCVLSVFPNQDTNSNRINDIEVYDSFDVFFDTWCLYKAQIGVLSSYESVDYLESLGYKGIRGIAGGQARSHSSLKNTFEVQHGKTDVSTEGSLLIDNVYYLEHDKNEDGSIKEDSAKVMHTVICGDKIIKDPEEQKGYKHLGQLFFVYFMEKSKFVKYPTPWMSELIPLQRSLNDSSENIDTLIHWIAKVRFMQREGASNTVQLIGDRHVQKLRFAGEAPKFMEFPAIPQDLFRQTEMREGQIEDMAGIHSASLGRSSGDRVSGRKEAVLAAGDADNVADPVRNLETFLVQIFAQILDNASTNMDKVGRITSGLGDSYDIVGSEYIKTVTEEKENKGKEVLPVRAFRNIVASVQPGSQSQLAQGRQEILTMMPILVNAGMNDKADALFEVLMRMYNSGSSRDIARLIEKKQQEEEAKNPDYMIAKAQADKLAMGTPVTAVPEEPHDLHIQLKTMALQNLLQKGVAQKSQEDPVFSAFMQNIMQHQSMLQGQGSPKMGISTIIQGVKPGTQEAAPPVQ